MAGKHLGIVLCAGVVMISHPRPAQGSVAAVANERQALPVRAEGAPQIAAGTDGKEAWLVARYRDLVIRKATRKKDRSVVVDVRLGPDIVVIALSGDGRVAVGRNGRSIDVTSPEAFEAVQQLLAGSSAMFGVRALLSEREATSELRAPEMSLLSAAAFIASLVGDSDAPRRLAARFAEKHHGIVRPVRGDHCWGSYSTELTAAWDDLQNCMNEADQDDSFFRAAYRRLACNGVWALRSESAWFEYINCLSPLTITG